MIQEMSADQVSYIFRNMEDAVCLTSRKGDLLYANPAAEKLFGLDRTADAKIWDVIPFVTGNDELIQLFIDGVMEKKSLQSLVDYYRKDGSKDSIMHSRSGYCLSRFVTFRVSST